MIEIIDMTPEYEDAYCMCLEEWSDEMKESGDYKKRWLENKKGQGLRVKLVRTPDGEIVGMIHYVPIEYSPVTGKGLYYIYCIWVHGYKEGVGNHQGKGIGRQLLKAAEEDAKSHGADGMAAWGIRLPFFMRVSWFKKNGYRKTDSDGIIQLVWKPFKEGAESPTLFTEKKRPEKNKDKLTVTCLINGWCPAQSIACERMKRAIAETGKDIDYIEIDTEERSNLLEWGTADAIYIGENQVRTGPPPSYERLLKLLEKKLKRQKRRSG